MRGPYGKTKLEDASDGDLPPPESPMMAFVQMAKLEASDPQREMPVTQALALARAEATKRMTPAQRTLARARPMTTIRGVEASRRRQRRSLSASRGQDKA